MSAADEMVGLRVRELRKMRGLSQSKLAEQIPGWLPVTLTKIENGQRRVTFPEGMALAAVLRVVPEALLSTDASAEDAALDAAYEMGVTHGIRRAADLLTEQANARAGESR